MSDTPIPYDPRVMPAPAGAIRVPFRPRLTQLLVGANVLVFVAMVLAGRTTTFGTQQLLRWGADYGPYTFDGQGWRIWTSTGACGIWGCLPSEFSAAGLSLQPTQPVASLAVSRAWDGIPCASA